MPSIDICCLVIMFYLTKRSCSFDVLKIQLSVGGWCCLRIWWGDAVMGWRDRENPGKVSFVRQGALGILRKVTRLDYTRKWYSLMMISRTENLVWKQCAVQDFFARDEAPQPQDRSKFISSASPGLNRRAHWAVSACQHQSPQHLNHSYSRTIQYPVNEKYYCYDSE